MHSHIADASWGVHQTQNLCHIRLHVGTLPSRNDALRQSEQALLGQLEQLASLHPRNPSRETQPAAPSGSGQPSEQPAASQQDAVATAGQAAPSDRDASTATGQSQSAPQAGQPGAQAQTPSAANAARGLAQALEGNAQSGRITSAMFGSAMEAAMAAARQVHCRNTMYMCSLQSICFVRHCMTASS